MVSFESFDHMLRFAKEVDAGLQYLEGKLRNPEKLLYCDREVNTRKAVHCFDSLQIELSGIHEEISNMLVTETEELKLMKEERDKIAEYLKEINREMKDYENKLKPYGYICKMHVNKVRHNLCNMENEETLECSLLEHMAVREAPNKINRDATFVAHWTNLKQSNKSFLEHYATPKFSEDSIPSCRTKLLSVKFNGVCGKSDTSWATEKKRKPLLLKNDITPKFNRVLFKEVGMCTPPDPGFSVISQKVYALSVGRKKQKKPMK